VKGEDENVGGGMGSVPILARKALKEGKRYGGLLPANERTLDGITQKSEGVTPDQESQGARNSRESLVGTGYDQRNTEKIMWFIWGFRRVGGEGNMLGV